MDSLLDNRDERDYLAELTGPGGKFDRTKYASEAEMYKAIAKGKVLADDMVNHKNSEFDQLRDDFIKVSEENNTKAKLDDYLARLANTKTDDTSSTQIVRPEVKPELDLNKLDDLLEQKLANRENARIEAANMATVEKMLRERFGDNAASILKDKMNTLGLTSEDVKFLAKKSPNAVINALGLNTQPQGTRNPPESNLRSDNFKPTDGGLRDAVYWEKLRKEKPKEYYSEKSSVQRLKDMEDPDFLVRHNQQNNVRAQYYN